MKRLRVFLVTAGVFLAFSAMTAQADVISVNNASFESPAITPNGYLQGGVPTGWTLDGQTGRVYIINGEQVVSDTGGYPAPDGAQIVELNTATGLWQNLGYELNPNYTYTLSFKQALAEEVSGRSYTAGLYVADDTSSLGTLLYGETMAGSATRDGWHDVSVSTTYTGASGKYLSIYVGSSSGWFGFDSISVTEEVPEPATMGLLAAGGLLALLRRRK